MNLVGIRQGAIKRRLHKPNNESILLIGAHFDTVNNTSGLNDNGSGIGVMLEIIRLLDYYQCETDSTIIFVAFDMEESVMSCAVMFSCNNSIKPLSPGSHRKQIFRA